MKNLVSILLYLTTSSLIYAQDIVFSQNFLVPETLNSSFTGAILTSKFGTIHKTEWRSIGLKTSSSFAYFDTYIPKYNTGLGITFLNHTESASSYTFNQVNLNFSMAFQMSDSWFFRPSLSAGLGSKSYGFQNLLLEDQISNSRLINTSSIDPILLKSQRSFLDFDSSIIFNNNESWIGATVKHINKPNISLSQTGNVPLDIFFSVHSKIFIPVFNNYRYSFWGMSKIYLLSNYMMQSGFSRLDIGTQYIYDDYISFGLTASTNPINNSIRSSYINSINSFASIKWKGFRIGYSFDMNTSLLGGIRGTHEFSLGYDFKITAREIYRYKCISYF